MIHCDTNPIAWPRLRAASGFGLAIAAAIMSMPGCSKSDTHAQRLEGLVFHDDDGNTVRNDREKGLARVPVSNGREVVLTDVRGRWFLPPDGPRTPFVIAPRGWRLTPSSDEGLAAMQPWNASPAPTVHVNGVVQDAPPPDATIGFGDAFAPMPKHGDPDTLPTAFNVGDLHVIVVDDRLPSPDNAAFVEADLLHAGAARPVLMVLAIGRGDLVQQLVHNRPWHLVLDSGFRPRAMGLNAEGDLVAYGVPEPGTVMP